MLTLFSQVLVGISIPMLSYRKSHGIQVTKFALFKLFPVLLTIGIMWTLCVVLTLTNVFEEGHPARTDVRVKVLTDASWFRIPYPGQFGTPTVSLAGSSKNELNTLNFLFITIIFYLNTVKLTH